MFISGAKTAEDFRKEVVAMLRQEAERRMWQANNARTKTDRMTAAARENELRRQALFVEGIKFFPRAEEG
jgi:hypothetical protein